MMQVKLNYGYNSVDEILERLLKIIPASELKKDKRNNTLLKQKNTGEVKALSGK